MKIENFIFVIKVMKFFQRRIQLFAVDGFEEIVDTIDFEGLNGVLVKRRGKDDGKLDIDFKDLHSSQSSLEDIFVSLVRDKQ